jgi:3-oxoacyl-[acyl-carrier-protein] synthase-3
MLNMGPSFKTNGTIDPSNLYLKMNGRRLYQYALETVPLAIKAALDKCGTDIKEISKVLIHQANGKMDEAILKRLYALYNITDIPANVMPMSISYLGNSSVATLPTLLDLILRDNLTHSESAGNHSINKGDKIVFASVGAGMNINALVYIV